MERRTVLKLMALASSSLFVPDVFSQKKVKVVVVGAGIIGASAAYYLARAGADVTIIDQQAPATHATKGTFAWLNATWAKQPQSYHHFNQISLQLWRDLAPTLGIPVVWNGSIEWFSSDERTTKLSQQISEQKLWGEDAMMLDATAMRHKEPMLEIADDVVAAFSGNDGALDPILATNRFLQAAKFLGATLRFPCRAMATKTEQGKALGLETDTGFIAADHIVVCAGADSVSIEQLSGMDIPQRTTPGVIAQTEPLPQIIRGIIAAPGVHMHQRHDGRVILGEQAGPPAGTAHKLRLQGRPNVFPNLTIAQQHGQRLLQDASKFFPKLQQARIEDTYIGWRPLPLDGHPVIGPSSNIANVYLAISHSGISLAPLIAKLLTQEILQDEQFANLENYRADRDFTRVVRY